MPDRGRHDARRLGFFQLVVPDLEPDRVVLGAAAARHLRSSLRARPGDRVPATDGAGGRGEVEILAWSTDGVEVRPRRLQREARPERRLWLATRAHDTRYDWLVEKAVELGVWGLLPLQAATGDGRGGRDRRARWERLAQAAVEQCGSAWLPRLEAPRPLDVWLAGTVAPPFTEILVADPAARPLLGPPPVALGPGDHLLVVGPPEGFSGAERSALEAAPGLSRASLGRHRLRSETAALALLALAAALPGPGSPPAHP